MFMVRRRHVENVAIRVKGQEAAHEDHISQHSRTIASGDLVDENGTMVGVLAISGHETWEAIRHYVYEDPYTKVGAYADIEIKQLNLYLLDAAYARAPDWLLEKHPELASRFTAAERVGNR